MTVNATDPVTTAATHADEDQWDPCDDEWDPYEEEEFRHDPEQMWCIARPDDECGIQLERFEDLHSADVKASRLLCGGNREPDLGCLDRSPLERVAPLLFDYCRRLRAGVLPAGHEADLDRLIAHAAATPHLDVVIADTRSWWDACPGPGGTQAG
jgi:hypothetical protein